jgi:hypothetical protein
VDLPRLLEIKPARVVFGHAVRDTEHLVALAPERNQRLFAALLALLHVCVDAVFYPQLNSFSNIRG